MSQAIPQRTDMSARGLRFALVAARWNAEIVEQLLRVAQRALEAVKADVMERFAAGEVSQTDYEKERERGKQRLRELMLARRQPTVSGV